MAESFDITEPLTKRLRGLLKEYPPGITVLREVLQNADDAGSRTVCYSVDTSSYAGTSLVDPSLSACQGPALLVYNDSVFTERDFDSLRKLGDSNKHQERIATGKFGLGFSSVYGWTDSPQILTGTTFVALSPHYSFEREEYKRSNGIRLNSVHERAGCDDSLAAFAAVTTQYPRPASRLSQGETVDAAVGKDFCGTIVRIPLRTKEQAEHSEICSSSVTTDDILTEFASFQNEVAESLLFLKNVECIEFRRNTRLLGSVRITNDIRLHRESLKSAIHSKEPHTSSFQIHLHHQFHLNDVYINRSQRYQIHHKLADITSLTHSHDFIQWTEDESVFPWIALAAPLSSSSPVSSRLFVSLPLPIFMPGNKVHIHGLFALSRDRRSLWTPADVQSSGKQTFETQWNSLLFKSVIPEVWGEFLVGVARELGREIGGYFPVLEGRALSVDETLLGDVLRVVVEGDEPVWYSLTGEVIPLSEGIVSFEEVPEELLDALRFMQVPLIHNLPSFLADALREGDLEFRTMSPRTIRPHLRIKFSCSTYDISVADANALLTYIMSDKQFGRLRNIPLFRCTDGTFHALVRPKKVNYEYSKILLATPEEQDLFHTPEAVYLDLSSLPKDVHNQIVEHADHFRSKTNLCVFGIREFEDFLDEEFYSHVLDSGTKRDVKWVSRVWKWIDSRGKQDLSNLQTILNGTKLIPLERTDEFRQLVLPCVKPVLVAAGHGGPLMLQIHERSGGKFPLVDEQFKISSAGFLSMNRCVVEPKELAGLLSWITADVIECLSGGLRNSLRHFIASWMLKRDRGIGNEEQRLIRKLPVFPAVTMLESMHFKSSFTALDTSDTIVVISDIPIVPIIPATIFLDGNSPIDAQFLSILGYPPISLQSYLKTVVCPNISTQPPWLLHRLIQQIFDNVTLTEDWVTRLRDIPFVTVRTRFSTPSPAPRLSPRNVIDSTSSIAELYFDNEAVFPACIYGPTGKYTPHLRMLGMKERFDIDVADERIRNFATRKGNPTLYTKSQALLEFLSDRTSSVPFQRQWKKVLWLPAISQQGKKVVLRDGDCRPESFRPLVQGVLGIVSMQVRDSLATELGWDVVLDPWIIAARIDVIVRKPSNVESTLAPILEYLKTKVDKMKLAEYVRSIRDHVKVERYFPGSTDGLWSNETIFFCDAGEYEPYLSVLPRSYARDYHDILKLFEIKDYPSPSDLLALLSQFPTDAPLEQADLAIVLRILEKISRSDIEPSTLLIPDMTGTLHTLKAFASTPTLFSHPCLSPEFTFKYQIPQVGDDTAFIKHLATTDFFEDYSQQESMTTRIRNTLKDYSLSTSFNEFVANAEDCGSATKVGWFLDSESTRFPTENLFSSDLAAWQTPALYVYNDGVFRDADFRAFIQTGGATKAGDSGKIGRYGLGSLTMYHFTDIPSLISGDYFVVFDPERRYLPVDRAGRRMAGMKIPISLMKASKRGHLVPFVGIGGYTLEMDRFEGTIFRLPLRTAAQVQASQLVEKDNVLQYAELWKQLDNEYFEQAKKSLTLLMNLNAIEFRLGTAEQGEDSEVNRRFHSRWTVGIREGSFIQKSPDSCSDEMPVEKVTFSCFDVAHRSLRSPSLMVENWLVVSAFLSKEAFERTSSFRNFPRKVFSSREKDSIPDVAVAVQLRPKPKPDGNFYSSLPLHAPTGLPISCHGHFIMSSDRRSIRNDRESEHWNKYLAEKCLSHLYFALLEYLCLGNTENYYAYWPGKTALDPISNFLLSSFWTNICRSSRQLVLSPDNKSFTFAQTILDGRVIPLASVPIDDPIARLVRVLRPQYLLINEPVLNTGLLPKSESALLPVDSKLKVLNPAFVRDLLRKADAAEALKPFNDFSRKKIIDFVLEADVSFDRVEGCYLWRLANDEFFRIARCQADSPIAYLADSEGYNLFSHFAKDRFIKPGSIPLREWDLKGSVFNVRALDGRIVDELICAAFPTEMVYRCKPPETTFIRRLWDYVLKKKLDVTFHQTCPTLPVQNDSSTFISLDACRKLPVMPPNIPDDMAKMCISLKIYILKRSEMADVFKMTADWNRDERFLECILRSQGNALHNLENIPSVMSASGMLALRQFAIDVVDRINRCPAINVLQLLPVWHSASENGSNESRIRRVKACQSLILKRGVYIDDLTNANIKERFVVESPDAIKAILKLGGKTLDAGTYAFQYILPDYDPPPNTAVPLNAIKKLLNQVLDHRMDDTSCRHLMKTRRLIPDGRGFPRYGGELYSRANRIFAECFKDDISAFPHQAVEQLPLEAFGLQTNVNKTNLFVCLRRLEAAVNAATETGLRSLWSRCHTVWTQWKQQSDQLALENWTSDDLTAISKIRCVPGYRPIPTPMYRAKFMEDMHERQVFTLQELYDPEYVPISWSWARFAASKPPEYLPSVGFTPPVSTVVDHLVTLKRQFAKKSKIENKAFFHDLVATYNFLSKPENIDAASQVLKSRYVDAPIWLNDDAPLANINAFVEAHATWCDRAISSLTWLASSAILHGVPYDLPSRGLYSAKPSLEPYSSLLRACGSHVVKTIKAALKNETVEDHGQQMLRRLRTLRESQPSLCDITIRVEGTTHYAHRILLAAVSTYFNRLCAGEWKEKETGVLILDGETYGTPESVGSVLEWIYNGYVELDDGSLRKDDLDEVQSRLDHYLDCLELSSVWDMPELRAHLENRILRFEGLFIRIENVSVVMDLATRYQADKLKAHCQEVIAANKDLVNLVDNTREE